MKENRSVFSRMWMITLIIMIIMAFPATAAEFRRIYFCAYDYRAEVKEKQLDKVGSYYFGVTDIQRGSYSVASYTNASGGGKKILFTVGSEDNCSILTNGKVIYYPLQVGYKKKVDIYSISARGTNRKKVCRINVPKGFISVTLCNIYQNKLYFETLKKTSFEFIFQQWIGKHDLRTGKTEKLIPGNVKDFSPDRRYIHILCDDKLIIFDCKKDNVKTVKLDFGEGLSAAEIFATKNYGWLFVTDDAWKEIYIYRYPITGTLTLKRKAFFHDSSIVKINGKYVYYCDAMNNYFRYSFATKKSKKITKKEMNEVMR